MAAMMASIAVGGAIGQNIAGSMNNMMSCMNQMPQAGVTPRLFLLLHIMTYKDREDEIIQSQIGQLDIAYSKLPFKLSWTHYQVLMRIEDKEERDFYER